MVVRDECNDGYYIYCLDPPLAQVPILSDSVPSISLATLSSLIFVLTKLIDARSWRLRATPNEHITALCVVPTQWSQLTTTSSNLSITECATHFATFYSTLRLGSCPSVHEYVECAYGVRECANDHPRHVSCLARGYTCFHSLSHNCAYSEPIANCVLA